MNQIIQSSNQTIASTDAPHIVASGLRIAVGVAARQVSVPRVGGVFGYSRG